MRWDLVFRSKMQSFLFDDFYDRADMISEISDDIREDIKEDVGWGIKDIGGQIRREIESDWSDKVLEEALERGIKLVRDDKDRMKNIIITRIANEIATDLLGEESKKLIKKKVEERMCKMRTYRSDLLDLDD